MTSICGSPARNASTHCCRERPDAAALGSEQALSAADAKQVRVEAGQCFQAVEGRTDRSGVEHQRNAAVLGHSERVFQLDGAFIAVLNLDHGGVSVDSRFELLAA